MADAVHRCRSRSARLLRAGEPFVYAYYDGVDKVAHERGFGPYYDAELRAADRLVGDLAAACRRARCWSSPPTTGRCEVGDASLATRAGGARP